MWRSSTALGCLLLVPFTGCTDPNSGDGSDDGITTFTTGATSGGEEGAEGEGTTGGEAGEAGEATESGEATTVGDGDGDSTTTMTTVGDGDGDGDSTTATTMTTAGDGDGDGDSGDGDGDGDGADTGCFNDELSFNPVPPSIVLVLDKSGSMSINSYDHDGNAGTPNVTRWNAVHQGVTTILNDYQDQVEFGVKLFPSTTGCGVNAGVEVGVAINNGPAILAAIPTATNAVQGSTPSGEGLQATLNYLTPLATQGAKAIIFMADGDVSCGTPGTIPAMETMLSNAFNATPSIPTYVVGINASGTVVGELNDLAVAGGVPVVGGSTQFYDTQNLDDFLLALGGIIGNLVSCDLVLDPPPPFPDNIDVNIGGVDAAQLDPTAPGFDCATQAGWYYSSPNVVRLCGPTCDTFNNLAMPTADITYFCTPG